MQFYLTSLDEKMKLPDENPSIGIIICKSKNRTRVEFKFRLTVFDSDSTAERQVAEASHRFCKS